MPDDLETTATGEEGAASGTTTEETPKPASTARGTATGSPVAPSAPTTPAAPKTAASTAWDGKALNERLTRERAAADKKWAAALGVADANEAKALIERARESEKAEKERRLAEMSEIDRMKAIIAEKDTEIARLSAELERTSTTVQVEKQDRIITTIASEYVAPRALNYAAFQFKAHLKTLSDDQIERMKERDVRKFFETFAKENPELAPAAAQQVEKPTVAKPAVTRKPITTGAPPPKKAPNATSPTGGGPSTFNGKTVLPGHKNSMSPAEVTAFAATLGVNYPGPGSGGRNGRSAR